VDVMEKRIITCPCRGFEAPISGRPASSVVTTRILFHCWLRLTQLHGPLGFSLCLHLISSLLFFFVSFISFLRVFHIGLIPIFRCFFICPLSFFHNIYFISFFLIPYCAHLCVLVFFTSFLRLPLFIFLSATFLVSLSRCSSFSLPFFLPPFYLLLVSIRLSSFSLYRYFFHCLSLA
jgi:hypothetical protein